MAPEREARVERIVEHGPGTRSLFLRLAEPLAFRPGQFISCLLPVGGETLTRAYSIASDPEDGALLEICLNRVPGGQGSAHLLALRLGATIRFTGPWGTFVLDRAPEVETVFLAEGTGIAPIRPMLHRALRAPRHTPLRLLHGAAGDGLHLYRSEMEALAQAHPAFRFDALPSAALVETVIHRFVETDGERGRRFFICGVGALVPLLRDLLRRAGYERRAVQYEKW